MLKKSRGANIPGLWMIVVMAFSLFTATLVSAQPADPTITVTAGSGGKITPDDDVQPVDIPYGTNKKFTIAPDAYYSIADVQAGPLGSAVFVYDSLTWNPTNKKIAHYKFVNVTENQEITATFALDTRKLTLLKKGTGTGLVTDDKGQVNCGLDCSGDYEYDTTGSTWPLVTLTVAVDEESYFQGWFDAAGSLLSKASPYATKMNKNKKIIAKFLKTHNLNVSMAGEGTGKITATLVPGTGKEFAEGVYKPGSMVTVKATPAFGSSFGGWSGDVSRTKKKITVTMDADKNITANFNPVLPLKIAEKVSVVEAKAGVGALRIGRFGSVGVPMGPPVCPDGSAYGNDQTHVYVEESSAETFSTINEILCKMAQAKYEEMLNKGPYKPQIDINLCKSGKDSASNAGQDSQNQSSGVGMPNYEMWTIDSTRADDTSPQIVKAWIHQKGNEYDPDMLIYAKVVITEGISEANPYGLFTVNFKGNPVMDGQIIDFPLMKGFMKTEQDPASGRILLKFTSKFDTTTVPPQYGVPPMTWIDKATLDKRADGTGRGTAYLYTYENFGQGQPTEDEVISNFAFDPAYFRKMKVGDPQTEMCLNRDDVAESVWSYGLYNPDGSRVNRNSGFSVMKRVGDKEYYGWIGYWGVWFPDEVAIHNGDTVYKVTYGPGGTEEPYTVLKSGGKLKKYSLKPLTLADIKNVPLDYSLGQSPQSTTYRTKWDGLGFPIFAKLDPMTGIWGPLEQGDPTTIDLGNLSYDMLFFYSQALNGMVQVKVNDLDGCTATIYWPSCPGPPQSCQVFDCGDDVSDSTPVNSFKEEVIYPADTLPAELVCFGNCPNPEKLTSEDPFDHYDWEFQINSLPADSYYATYTFDTGNMVLKRDEIDVIAVNPAQNFPWGITSGPLFDPSHLDLLACEINPYNPDDPDSTCGWKTWSELPEFYVWETGPNTWNQFIALKDPSTQEVLEFEPPLLVSYVHHWDLINNPGDISLFYLEYSGFGTLNGIPGKCVDPGTGNGMPCGPNSRWVPEFNIPEGSRVDDVASGIPYFAKPLEMEQRMKPTETMDPCKDLGLTIYPLPNFSNWVDPNIGTEPVVEGPPAVIGGVVQ